VESAGCREAQGLSSTEQRPYIVAKAFDSAPLIWHLAGIIYTQQQFHKAVFHAQ